MDLPAPHNQPDPARLHRRWLHLAPTRTARQTGSNVGRSLLNFFQPSIDSTFNEQIWAFSLILALSPCWASCNISCRSFSRRLLCHSRRMWLSSLERNAIQEKWQISHPHAALDDIAGRKMLKKMVIKIIGGKRGEYKAE